MPPVEITTKAQTHGDTCPFLPEGRDGFGQRELVNCTCVEGPLQTLRQGNENLQGPGFLASQPAPCLCWLYSPKVSKHETLLTVTCLSAECTLPICLTWTFMSSVTLICKLLPSIRAGEPNIFRSLWVGSQLNHGSACFPRDAHLREYWEISLHFLQSLLLWCSQTRSSQGSSSEDLQSPSRAPLSILGISFAPTEILRSLAHYLGL